MERMAPWAGKDTESQLSRFSILAQIANLNHCSVLDAGCGHADLSAYLRKIYPEVRYYGIEQIPEFLDIAVQRYGKLTDIMLYQGDFYTKPSFLMQIILWLVVH